MKLSGLETRLFDNPGLELAQAGLIASGVKTQAELSHYLARFDYLCGKAAGTLAGKDDVAKAEALFDWLWQTKPGRYKLQGDFKLTRVLDAQLGEESHSVGNCLGLTLLYNALAQRFDLEAGAIHLEDAFGRGPHVFSILYAKGGFIDIENIFASGFNYRGHLGNSQRVEWDNAALVSDVYLGLGNNLFDLSRYEQAIANYDKAIRLNPRYARAHLNKGMALCQLGRTEEASQSFNQTIA